MTKPTTEMINTLLAVFTVAALSACGVDDGSEGAPMKSGKRDRLGEWFPEEKTNSETPRMGEIHREGTDIIDFETTSIFAVESEGQLVVYASNYPYVYKKPGDCVGRNALALTGNTFPQQETMVAVTVSDFEVAEAEEEQEESPSQWIFAVQEKEEEKQFFSSRETTAVFHFPEGENEAIGTVRFYQGIPERKAGEPTPFSAHVDIEDGDGEMFYEAIFEAEIYARFCE